MDDTQFGALVMVLNRIGDALEQNNMLLLASRPAAPAPNLRRPLAAYATFDWAQIGASEIAHDDYGATEVEWNGRTFKRYSSREEDEKGIDVRFRRVVSGTVAERNIVWETLIKFADGKPAKKLRGEAAEAVQAAKQQAPASKSPEKPSAPASQPSMANSVAEAARTLGGVVRETPAPGAPLGAGQVSVPVAPPPTRSASRSVEQKTEALMRMATTGDQWGHHDAPADKTTPMPPPSALADDIEIGPAEQARTEIASQVKRGGSRQATPAQHAEVAAALKTHGLEWDQFCRLVWDRAAADVTAGWVLGTHGWLRPARNKTATFAANPTARQIIKALAEAVPA